MSQFKNIGKIGLGIVAFEGCEHLYNIISELRKPTNVEDTDNYNLVDTVVVCLQKVGYDDNKKLSNIDLNECIRLRDEDHLVDEIIFPELDTTKKAREQETDKRNFIIDTLKEKYGCDYAIIIDSDEFYTHKSFKRACEVIDANKYPITYCEYCNYFGTNNPEQLDYSYRMLMKYPFAKGMFVPFLIKTDYKFKFNSTDFNRPSDPTRRVSIPVKEYKEVKQKDGTYKKVPAVYEVDFKILDWNVCKMHHLSWLRADIRKKLESWSSKKLFKEYNDLIDNAVQHFNKFDVHNPNPQAVMLFNTPENKIDIQILDKQYIFPKVDYRTRLRPAKDYKKLLVLSMSADTELYNALEKTCNETWRNIDREKYPDIDVDFWTYTDAPDNKETYVDKKNHIIYIKKDDHFKNELLYATFSKTIEAFKIIKDMGLNYEYMIRTNNSTWINVPLLNEILAYEHNSLAIYSGTLYAAFWSAFNVYGGGNLMCFSKRMIDIILNFTKDNIEVAKKLEQKIIGCDDNIIFGLINNRNINLKIPYNDVYHSLGCQYLSETPLDYKDTVFDFTAPAFQVKTFNAANTEERTFSDTEKMRLLDIQWRTNTRSIEDLYNDWKESLYNKDIVILNYSKEEWRKCGKDVERIKPENSHERIEALKEFLPNKQKELGYPTGLFI